MTIAESHRTTGRPNWLTWAIILPAIAIIVGNAILFSFNRHTSVPESWSAAGGPRLGAIYWLRIGALSLQSLAGVTLGALIIARRRNDRIGWLMVFSGYIAIVVQALEEFNILMLFALSQQSPLVALTIWVQNWIWVFNFIFILLVALIPSGHFLSRRWMWIVGLPLLLALSALLIGQAAEVQMSSALQQPNPFFTRAPVDVNALRNNFGAPMLVISFLALLAQVVARYRAGTFVERQQIKWLVVGAGAMVIAVTLGLLLALGAGLVIGAVLVESAFIFPMLGIGIGMLRYRLYDVDLIVRRTAVYGLLTGALALVYFGSVIALESIARRLTGQSANSPLIIVFSTLLIAALFTPLRRRLQAAIDRRFYRSRYDAAQTLAQFARSARDEVQLEALSEELLRVVEETMQPESVRLWLRAGQGKNPGDF